MKNPFHLIDCPHFCGMSTALFILLVSSPAPIISSNGEELEIPFCCDFDSQLFQNGSCLPHQILSGNYVHIKNSENNNNNNMNMSEPIIQIIIKQSLTFLSQFWRDDGHHVPDLINDTKIIMVNQTVSSSQQQDGQWSIIGLRHKTDFCPMDSSEPFLVKVSASALTRDGWLNHDGDIYPSDNFCIDRIENSTVISLMVCKPLPKDPIIYIPKCCPWGSQLYAGHQLSCVPSKFYQFDNETSEKVTERNHVGSSSASSWRPQVYSAYDHRVPIIIETEKRSPNQQQLHFYVENIPKTCHGTPIIFFEANETLNFPKPYLHIFSQLRFIQDGSVDYVLVQENEPGRWNSLSSGRICLDTYEVMEDSGRNFSMLSKNKNEAVVFCIPPNIDNVILKNSLTIVRVLLTSSTILSILACAVYIIVWTQYDSIHWRIQFSFFFSITCLYTLVTLVAWQIVLESEPVLCFIVSVIIDFTYLATVTWLTVISVDLFRQFRVLSLRPKFGNKIRTFLTYCAIGWGVPGIIVICGIFLHFFVTRNPNRPFDIPTYGKHACVHQYWTAQSYTLAILLVINMASFGATLFLIFRHKRNTKFASQNSSSATTRMKARRESIILVIKLFLVMGLLWPVDVAHAILTQETLVDLQPTMHGIIILFLTSSQGIFIFAIYIPNQKIYKGLKRVWPSIKKRIPKCPKFSSSVPNARQEPVGSTGETATMSKTGTKSSQQREKNVQVDTTKV